MKTRAVFDCMVFLQGAMRANGPAAACFRLVDAGGIELCVSAELLAEVKDVFARPSLQRRYKTLAPESVKKFMAQAEGNAILIADIPQVFSHARDPKDELYVNLAAAAGARFLVTRDRDLLDLMDETSTGGKDFRQRFPQLKVLDPVAFLQEVRGPQQSPESGP